MKVFVAGRFACTLVEAERPSASEAAAVMVFIPSVRETFVLAKVLSPYRVADWLLTVALVAGDVVVPATVSVPVRLTVVSSFALLTAKVSRSALLVR